jgi:hypothetical protein
MTSPDLAEVAPGSVGGPLRSRQEGDAVGESVVGEVLGQLQPDGGLGDQSGAGDPLLDPPLTSAQFHADRRREPTQPRRHRQYRSLTVHPHARRRFPR